MQRSPLSHAISVLAALTQGPALTGEVFERIKQRSGGSVAIREASMQCVLRLLARKGLLDFVWVPGPHGGHRARRFGLTEKGRDWLAERVAVAQAILDMATSGAVATTTATVATPAPVLATATVNISVTVGAR